MQSLIFGAAFNLRHKLPCAQKPSWRPWYHARRVGDAEHPGPPATTYRCPGCSLSMRAGPVSRTRACAVCEQHEGSGYERRACASWFCCGCISDESMTPVAAAEHHTEDAAANAGCSAMEHTAESPVEDAGPGTPEATTGACRDWKRTSTKKFRLCATDVIPLRRLWLRTLQQLRKSPRRPVHARGTLRAAMLGGATAAG